MDAITYTEPVSARLAYIEARDRAHRTLPHARGALAMLLLQQRAAREHFAMLAHALPDTCEMERRCDAADSYMAALVEEMEAIEAIMDRPPPAADEARWERICASHDGRDNTDDGSVW